MPVDCFFMTMIKFRFGWSNEAAIKGVFSLVLLFTFLASTKTQWSWWKGRIKNWFGHTSNIPAICLKNGWTLTSCWWWLFLLRFQLASFVIVFLEPLHDYNLSAWCCVSFIIFIVFIVIITTIISNIRSHQYSFQRSSLMFMRLKFNKC